MRGKNYYYPSKNNTFAISQKTPQIQTEFEPALNNISEFSVHSPFNHTPKINEILNIHNNITSHQTNKGKRSKRQIAPQNISKNSSENKFQQPLQINNGLLDQFKIKSGGKDQSNQIKMNQMVNLIKQYQNFNDQLIKQSEENVYKFNQYLNDMQKQLNKKIQDLKIENQLLRETLSEKERSFEQLQVQTAKWMEDYQQLYEQMNKQIINKYQITIKQKDNDIGNLQRCFKNLKQQHSDNINFIQQALGEKERMLNEMRKINNQLCSKISQQRCRHHDCSEIRNWVKKIAMDNSDNQQQLQKVRSQIQLVSMKTQFDNHKKVFEQQKAQIIEQLELVIQEKDQANYQLQQTQRFVEKLKRQLVLKDKEILQLKNDRKTVSRSINIFENTSNKEKQSIETSKFQKTALHYDWSQTFFDSRRFNQLIPIQQENYYLNANRLKLQTEKNKNEVLNNVLKVQQILNASLRKRLNSDVISNTTQKKIQYQICLQDQLFSKKIQSFQTKIVELNKLFFKVQAFLQSLFTDKIIISNQINPQIYQQITRLRDILATQRYVHEKFENQLMEKIIKHLPKNIIEDQNKENTPKKHDGEKNNRSKKHQRSRTGIDENEPTTRLSILNNLAKQRTKNIEKLRY